MLLLAALITASPPNSACFDEQLRAALASPALAQANVGFLALRLRDSAVLGAQNADRLLIPASNVKLVTTAAALDILGPAYRFETAIYGNPDSAGHVAELHIRGNGDPWLVPERLWYLANRIYYAGVREVRDIVIDDSYFDNTRDANGAEQDRSSYAYMAPIGAVSVGFNSVLVHVAPGVAAGAAASVLVEPRQNHVRVENRVTTIERGRTKIDVSLDSDGPRSVARVRGQIALGEEPRGFWRHIDNPPLFAGEALRAMLVEIGVRVNGKVRGGATPENMPTLVTFPSPPLSEILARINQYSNNFMAEQLARAVGAKMYGAPATWEKARDAVGAFLQRAIHLEPSAYAYENGSGLHDVNRFSARQFVDLLTYMQREPYSSPEYMASLAIAGATGTLSSRMQDSEALGLLRAKTGTLATASTLSGYVRASDGDTLAFALLVNDFKGPLSDVLAVQDQIGTLLAGPRTACLPTPAVATQLEGRAAP